MRSDEELMAAHVRGEPGAFRELFDRHAAMLEAVLRRSLPRADDARDLVQQTFLHVHRARNDFRQGEPFRPWLFTIALNVKREYFRRRARRSEEPLGEHVSSGAAPDANADAGRVRAALARLPAAQSEVILLHWFAGLAFPEIAGIVGASLPAVKVRAHRGYERLRVLLAETEVTAAPAAPYPAKESR